jgi:hypothetical protein
MKKIKVADYHIEEFDIQKPVFCYSITIYFTFYQDNIEALEIDDLDYFNIMAGTPNGLGVYFERILNKSDLRVIFWPHLAVVQKMDKKILTELIKEKLENIIGKDEKEIIRKAMTYSDWQYQDDDIELHKLFSR